MAAYTRTSYKAKKGYYTIKNPSKYNGPMIAGCQVLYRSSWEQRMFHYMDINANVVAWSTEHLTISYYFHIEKKYKRYYPDIVAKIKTRDGIKTFIIEVKPVKQTLEPKKPQHRIKTNNERYKKNMYEYQRNQAKWKATEKYCNKNGFIFKIFTEREIFGKKKK